VNTRRYATSNNNGYSVFTGSNTAVCPYTTTSSSGGSAATGISLGIIIPLICICFCLFGLRRRRMMVANGGMNYVNMGGAQETVIVNQGPYAAPPVPFGGATAYAAPPVPFGGNQTVVVEERGRFGRVNETIVVNTF
jgi:hypothetical protein